MELTLGEQLDRGREHWAAGKIRESFAAVQKALQTAPGERSAKLLMVDLLRHHPAEARPEMAPLLLRLLRDPEIDPVSLNRAGWMLQRQVIGLLQNADSDSDLECLANLLDGDELTLTLLRESPVGDRVAEKTLTRLRRWLAISGHWRDHMVLVDALGAQTEINGGAWPFDETERHLLDDMPGTAIARAYLPGRAVQSAGQTWKREDLPASVTRVVAEQYERWPYPVWRRLNVPVPSSLPKVIRKFDAQVADGLRANSSILVAGCGTGCQAAQVALRYPDAHVTAIDISAASLSYARKQCAALHIPAIRFIQLDLHDAGVLGEKFDAVFCSGVLHHLPDPEAGWAALSRILRPGGVMKIMVYSQLGRLDVRGARTLFRDLLNVSGDGMPIDSVPCDDDLVRRIRLRLLTHDEKGVPSGVLDSPDFSTIAATRDLLLHPREDPFNVTRIARALDQIGLRLLSFLLPTPVHHAAYNALFPEDPLHRDFRTWIRFEFLHPGVFRGMYAFWCYKPSAVQE
jgi:SAM-dependent methyltransferase